MKSPFRFLLVAYRQIKSEIASKCFISDLFFLNRRIKRPKNPVFSESMEVFLTLLYPRLDSKDKGARKHLKDWHLPNPFLWWNQTLLLYWRSDWPVYNNPPMDRHRWRSPMFFVGFFLLLTLSWIIHTTPNLDMNNPISSAILDFSRSCYFFPFKTSLRDEKKHGMRLLLCFRAY